MATLREIFDRMVQDGTYFYYNSSFRYYQTFGNLIEKSQNFVEGYFGRGGKKPMIMDIPQSPDRYRHMIFVYFLGLYLYRNIPQIQERIDQVIKDRFDEYRKTDPEKSEDDIRFEYVWFMLSLYHDMFFGIERPEIDENEEVKKKEERNKIIKFCTNKGYSIRKRLPPLLKGSIPKAIKKKTVKAYNTFKKRRLKLQDKAPFYDHGIAAGYAHYRFIKQQYEDTQGKPITLATGKKIIFSRFNAEVLAPKIAWTLIGHNIFQISKDSGVAILEQYKDMPELISDTPIVNLREHPLLFLLDLVDTIDPCKCGGFDADKALNRTMDIIKNEEGAIDLKIEGWTIYDRHEKKDRAIVGKDLAWLIPMEAKQQNQIIQAVRFNTDLSVTAVFKQ